LFVKNKEAFFHAFFLVTKNDRFLTIAGWRGGARVIKRAFLARVFNEHEVVFLAKCEKKSKMREKSTNCNFFSRILLFFTGIFEKQSDI
jgi:hypothetical protein